MTGTARTLPEGRYGKQPSRRPRWSVALMVAGGLALGVLAAFLAYRNLGAAPISTERAAFANLPGDRMRFTFDVTRRTPEQAAVCVVRVRTRDGVEGGRREVYIAPGADRVRVETIIRSTSEPVTADVFGCSYQVPAYLSTSAPPSG